jgi:hypothetical protein
MGRQPGRAGEGEHVTVCIETIKADKKADFEHLLHDVLGPAGLEVNGRVFESTRLLEPREANADGTWCYVSLLDPVVHDGDYKLKSTLERKYGPDKAQEYVDAYNECYAAPVLIYRSVQSTWSVRRAA